MGGLGRKAEAGLVIILVAIIVLFFFGWLINIGQRECKSNKDCGSEAYCGSDFACHQYPNIQKTIVQYSLFWPAVIIGIAIVAAAFIIKFGWLKPVKSETQKIIIKEPEEVVEISEPYYKSGSNAKTP
ncbi:hypothetical protein HYT53_05345 [Candidatus Woesearchaeota archaeon]|nr:hypothetical protein [Candidatus Woesearchaeota archaeon]